MFNIFSGVVSVGVCQVISTVKVGDYSSCLAATNNKKGNQSLPWEYRELRSREKVSVL